MKLLKWWILNIGLALILALLIWHKLPPRQLEIDCTYGSRPDQLLGLMKKQAMSTHEKKISIVFVFRGIPDEALTEMMQKLYMMNMDTIRFSSFFAGDETIPKGVPFLAPIKKKITCRQGADDFYVILNGEKIAYFDTKFDLFRINLALHQRMQTSSEFSDIGISDLKLAKQVSDRFQKGPVSLWNTSNGKMENVTLSDLYSRIAFFHSSCSPCDLKNYMNRIEKGDGKTLVIFSFFAVSSEIQRGRAAYEVNDDLYVDQLDEFNLKKYYLGAGKNPVMIPCSPMQTDTTNKTL